MKHTTRHTALGQYRWLAALAAFPTSILLAGTAGAAEPAEDQGDQAATAAPAAAAPPKAEVPSPPVAGEPAPAPAPATPASYFEHLGPDTFPGTQRGLYGGSLWLEPSFHGLQWPQNTHTGVGLSGYVWVDTGYENISRGESSLPNSTLYIQQDRAVFRVTPAYVSGDFFIQGQIELAGSSCQTAAAGATICQTPSAFSTDDLWLSVGQRNRWDVKVGRFQGWEIYHLGMGMDQYTLESLGAGMFNNPENTGTGPALEVPTLYGVDYMRYRPGDGLAVGYVALHAYFTDWLRLEVLGKVGDDNYQANNAAQSTSSNYLGGRPTLIFDFGWLKLKAGAEYEDISANTQTIPPDAGKKDAVEKTVDKGAGGSALFVFDPTVEFGVSGAIGRHVYTNAMATVPPDEAYTTKSVGGFANFRLAEGWLAGLGLDFTSQLGSFQATSSSANDYVSQVQGFIALQYLLAGQLYIKAVFAYAHADFQPSDVGSSSQPVPTWANNMYSGRLRLMYLF
ncbi:MAG: hypothetical protein ABSB49_02770 [Polyangia bacterium]|jgi:hypothetical protein